MIIRLVIYGSLIEKTNVESIVSPRHSGTFLPIEYFYQPVWQIVSECMVRNTWRSEL